MPTDETGDLREWKWTTEEPDTGDSVLWKQYGIEMPRWLNPNFHETEDEEEQYCRYPGEADGPEPWLDAEKVSLFLTTERDCALVTSRSPSTMLAACYRLACYFRKEMGYDFVQFPTDAWDVEEERKTVLLLDETSSVSNHVVVHGALDFLYNIEEGKYKMMWAWLHPFRRNRRKVSTLWHSLEALFGMFDLEPPLSRTMERIVAQSRRPSS